jgi:hypothetical protein
MLCWSEHSRNSILESSCYNVYDWIWWKSHKWTSCDISIQRKHCTGKPIPFVLLFPNFQKNNAWISTGYKQVNTSFGDGDGWAHFDTSNNDYWSWLADATCRGSFMTNVMSFCSTPLVPKLGHTGNTRTEQSTRDKHGRRPSRWRQCRLRGIYLHYIYSVWIVFDNRVCEYKMDVGLHVWIWYIVDYVKYIIYSKYSSADPLETSFHSRHYRVVAVNKIAHASLQIHPMIVSRSVVQIKSVYDCCDECARAPPTVCLSIAYRDSDKSCLLQYASLSTVNTTTYPHQIVSGYEWIEPQW